MLIVTGRKIKLDFADVKMNDDSAKAKNGVVLLVRVHAVVMAFFSINSSSIS
jgi:hypothetical protein